MEFIETKKITNDIAKITLTNGKKYNPLSLYVLRLLNNEINNLSKDTNIKVIIISSNGPWFSAGHDLQELKENKNNKEFFVELFNECSDLMLKIMNIPQPVIAEVPGVAAAAGCQLVATCDLAIASSDAVFITPGVNIGLFCSTPMVAVSRSLGRKKTMEMLLTGESMNANDAVNFGLINKNVSLNELEKTVLNFAKLIASTNAKFATPGVNIGLFCSTPMVALSRNISNKHSMEMLITGDLIDAQTAQNFGLINKVVSPEKLNNTVTEIANKILKKSYTTIATGKKAFYHQLELGISKAYDFTSEVMAENMIEYNAQEGVEAFLQKRSPIWKD